MQQAISQNSGLLAASDMAGDKLVKSNVSAAKIARHVTGCLNAFAFIKPSTEDTEGEFLSRLISS